MLRPVWRSFMLLRRRQKIIFLGIVFARVVVHGLDVLGLAAVGLLGAMLASGLTERPDAQFLGITVPVSSSETYLWVAVVIAGFFMAKSALGTILLWLTTLFLARVEARSASEVARYLFSGDISRVRSMSKGEIQWAVSTSSNIAFSTVLYAGSALITESALFLAIFAGFLVVDVQSAMLITLYFLVLIGLFQLSINQRLRRLGSRMREHAIRINNSVLDMANAFRESLVLEKRHVFLNRFDVSRGRQARDQSLQRFVMALPRFFVEAALMVGIMTLVVWQFARGTLSEGLVVTGIFLAGGTRMMAAMLPLQNAINDLRIYGPQAERAQSLITIARSEGDGSQNQQLLTDRFVSDTQEGVDVLIDAATFTYPDAEAPALSEITLSIRRGQFAAFVGPSGAGKTTLADLVLGVHSATEGSVEVAGVSPERLRRSQPGVVSYVPQSPGMVSGSIAENVALGVEPEEIDSERVEEVLAQAGLLNVVSQLPNGIHTSLGEQADALSGGQIQRLGLARALYTAPKLLVLDEATSALDAETEAGIAETLRKLRGHTTLIVIAHRLSTIQHADRVFVIEDGRVSASGTFSQVRREVPLIERYVQLMSIKDAPDDESSANRAGDPDA